MSRLGIAAVLFTFNACGPSVSPGADGSTTSDSFDARPDAVPWVDEDNDGYASSADCDDSDPAVNPAASEDCNDEIDNNCNGQTDTDLECLDPCELAAFQDSYFGCEFYAVDLPQYSLDKLYGISVSNPSDTEAATVTIATALGIVATLSVPANGVQTYEDSSRSQNVGTPGISNRAFHLSSDLPIAAYQFNSLDTIGAASTDASLLFAKHTLAQQYYSMDYDARTGDDSFIAVVGTEPDTTVEISPTTAVSGATTATIGPRDVMLVMAQTAGQSLTGSRISASKPVSVFGGNRCVNIPQGMSYCDHIEQQIFPRQAMGDRYIVGKTHTRSGCTPVDYIRVMADESTTTVTFDPPVAGPWTLNAGEWMETTISTSVEIQANHAILVGQFIRSSNGGECNDEGDPAFITQVPVQQYRTDYVFLTPPTYQTDYVDIIAPLGATVLIDGAAMALNSTPIGATNHTLTSVVVEDGAHTVDSNLPVGVMVYGFGGPSGTGTQNVSYGYPAGLNLSVINPIE